MQTLTDYCWVALGSALGGIIRCWLSGLITQRWNGTFPWGILVVNVSGSFLIGLLAALVTPAAQPLLSRSGRLFVLIGVLGGYTTFSSFSLQTLDLARQGQWGVAGTYVLASVALCLLGVTLGHWTASRF